MSEMQEQAGREVTELDRPLYDPPRRYWIDPPTLRGPGERLSAWTCRCHKLKNRQHREPWQCLTDADLLPWWSAHPEFTGSAASARRLAWLEYEFGP